MKRKIVDLTLPEWAWVDAMEQDRAAMKLLEGRNLILHIRSASLVEILSTESFVPKGDNLSYRFTYHSPAGIDEDDTAVLHYSAGSEDPEVLKNIVIGAAKKYMEYCTMADFETLIDGFADEN